MKRIAGWLALAVLVGLGGGNVLLAQKAQHQERRVVTLSDDGNQIYFAGGARAWMGVTLEDVTSDEARQMKLPGDYGALVTEVEKDSPAAKAGIEKNDVIVRYAGDRVWSMAQLTRWVRDTPPGRTVPVEVSRDGQMRKVSVTLERREASFGAWPAMPRVEMPEVKIPEMNLLLGFGGPRLGVSAAELTPQLASYFGVAQGKGVLVREVSSGSAAEKAGIKAGDCIIRLNSTEIDSVDNLRQALRDLFKGKTDEKESATVTLVRDRRQQTVTVEIENPQSRWPQNSEEAWSQYRTSAKEYEKRAHELQSQIQSGTAAQAKALAEQRSAMEKMRAELLSQKIRRQVQQRALEELEQQLRNYDNTI